ncbi:MAG: type II toxin-antitoxin system Phd/YefM family antitoxin [Chloroflexi bacterium]|nr:type II toxin-antitoxin system Phd/YefM family antitoxin [Chloroflexota bacterium]
MTTETVSVSDLRRRTTDVVQVAQCEDAVIYITQHGRPAAALMSYERYESLLSQLEDLSDLAALQAAADEPARPYEEFLAEVSFPGPDQQCPLAPR